MVELHYVSILYTQEGCTSTFYDGSEVKSIPHPDDHHYHVIANRLGYCDDVMAYCREHDFSHHFVAQYLFEAPSIALWGVAHGRETSPEQAAYEEMAVQMFQRWLRANEQPIIGGVDWHKMKAEALALLG